MLRSSAIFSLLNFCVSSGSLCFDFKNGGCVAVQSEKKSSKEVQFGVSIDTIRGDCVFVLKIESKNLIAEKPVKNHLYLLLSQYFA